MAIMAVQQTIVQSGGAVTASLGDASAAIAGSITFQLEGVTGTYTPQATIGGTYVTVAVVNMDTPGTFVTTITASGIYRVDMFGLRTFRLSHPGGATGSATLSYQPTLG
mgnify:CR=1 FL=1